MEEDNPFRVVKNEIEGSFKEGATSLKSKNIFVLIIYIFIETDLR